jgi:hypothetical protein
LKIRPHSRMSVLVAVKRGLVSLLELSLRYEAERAGGTIGAVVDDIRVLLRFLVVVNQMGPACSVIAKSVAFFAAEQHFLCSCPIKLVL